MICKCPWCDEETGFGKGSWSKRRSSYCHLHIQYKNWVKMAPSRVHLFYKLEKVLEDKLECEECGYNPRHFFKDRPLKQLVTLMDVDHIDSSMKLTKKGEHPDNYKLVCKACHILKSHDNRDFVPKKYKQKGYNNNQQKWIKQRKKN